MTKDSLEMLETGIAKDSDALSDADRAELQRQEETIREGLSTFLVVGAALAAIKQKRLYRESFRSFESYCRIKWRISSVHAYRLLNAASLVPLIEKQLADTPLNEATLRPLTRIPRERVATVWNRVLERVAGGRVTASLVKKTISEMIDSHEEHPRKCRRQKIALRDAVLPILDELSAALKAFDVSAIVANVNKLRTLFVGQTD